MIARILFLLLFMGINSISAQILIGAPEDKDPSKKDPVKPISDTTKKRELDGSSFVYFVTNWSVNNRLLKENVYPYGDSLGERAFEEKYNTWSFGIGIQNQLNAFLMWDGGISYYRHGEQYNFIQSDTTFHYQTTYSYISMPLRLNFTYGKNVKLIAGGGLLPQMFTGYKQERQWTTSTNSSGSDEFKTKSGYNPFILSAIFNVGCALDFQNNWSLFVSPEARIQLTSSYLSQDDYIHKNRAYGITFGLIRSL